MATPGPPTGSTGSPDYQNRRTHPPARPTRQALVLSSRPPHNGTELVPSPNLPTLVTVAEVGAALTCTPAEVPHALVAIRARQRPARPAARPLAGGRTH